MVADSVDDGQQELLHEFMAGAEYPESILADLRKRTPAHVWLTALNVRRNVMRNKVRQELRDAYSSSGSLEKKIDVLFDAITRLDWV